LSKGAGPAKPSSFDKLRMTDDKLRMTDDKLRMTDDKLRMTDDKLRMTFATSQGGLKRSP